MTAAKERDIDMDFEEAREHIYGSPYEEWKNTHQKPATDEQKAMYEKTKPLHAITEK